MPPSETYVVDILKDILNNKVQQFETVSVQLHNMWSGETILDNDKKEQLETYRRELRGEMSALRQAIKKLEV